MTKFVLLAWKSTPLRIAGLALPLIGLALLPLAMTGCGNTEANDEEKSHHVVEVQTTKPQRKDLVRDVQQPGWMFPYEQTPIYTKISGFAEDVKYDIGDYLKKGTKLLDVYVPEVVEELEVKKARVEQAEADLLQSREFAKAAEANVRAANADVNAKDATIKSAEADVKRWIFEKDRGYNLLGQKIFDKQTYDEIVKQLESSNAHKEEAVANKVYSTAKVSQAMALLEKAKADITVANAGKSMAKASEQQWLAWLSYARITAPYDGVITVRNVHSGHFLQASNSGSTSKAAEPLFVMMRTDLMRCVVEVPELDAFLVQDGDKAIIHFDALPGLETIGTVTRNSGALDSRARTLRVEVHVKNPSGATITYTVGKDGTITSVDPTPPRGGAKYPPNSTIPLNIVGGSGGVVYATTNADGVVVGYSLKSGGKYYPEGRHVAGEIITTPSRRKYVAGETIANVYRPFMYGHATIQCKLQNAWMLPERAIINDNILANNGRSYCWVVDKDGKARRLFLQIGANCGTQGIQILHKATSEKSPWELVSGNEVVITTNNKGLEEGQEVHVEAPQAN